MNVQMRVHILRTFVTHLLVHMCQKKKIALEIAAQIARVSTFVLQDAVTQEELIILLQNFW